MRITHTWLLAAGVAAASACSDDNTSPTDGGNGAAAADNVVVGNDFFRSEQNGSQDPAVDTVAAGGAVTWTWIGTGATSHSVRSEGPATFASSSILAGEGQTYSVTFDTPGTYQYDCEIHGDAMTGTVVVQ